MKFQVFLLSLTAAAFARAEAGYTFSAQPSSNYLPSQGSYSGYDSAQSSYSSPSSSYNHNDYHDTSYVQEQKSVYFFAAPDEEEVSRLRVHVEPSSRRHTKVIFIKASSHGHVVPEVIAPPSEAVDRTVVYVLSKKQHDGGSVTVPAHLGTRQSKPEVYFIKYKNQHDVQGALHRGLNGHSVGHGLDDLGSAQAFSSNLGGFSSGYANHGYTSNNGYSSVGSSYNGGISSNYGAPSGGGPYYR